MGLTTLKRLFRKHPYILKRKYQEELSLLNNSELFSARYYLWKHKDVAKDKYWSKNPELHFLLIGGSEKRKCSKWFDTAWYVEQYEDVYEEGVNPLIHYLKNGQKEGRRMSGRKYSDHTRDARELLRNTTIGHLWGGYSTQALADLAAYYESDSQPNELRYFAAWHAARWYFYVQQHDKVLELALLIASLDASYTKEKNTAMMLAYGYLAKEDVESARHVVNEFLKLQPNDTDMLLTLANTFSDDVDILATVNRIFMRRNMATITKRDSNQPLSFENITGKTVPVHHSKKITVVMPTFNAEDKIQSALTSLLEQSWQNLEIIVVDDCSTDNTFGAAQEIANKDSRVKVFKQGKNGGAYLARNRGLLESTGDFITTHDSDDWSHPEKLETQVSLLLRKEKIMGICTHWTRALDDLTFTHNWNLNERLLHWNHSSFLFRRQVLDDLGPWDSVIVGGDTEFIWRVQSFYGKHTVVKYKPNIPYSFALDDDASLTRTKATHVSTIHNGLRHLYRSAAKWWHAEADKPVATRTNRQFPAPKPMLKRGDAKFECDELFIGDFSKQYALDCLALKIQEAQQSGKSVGLLHWPQYGTEKEELLPQFFNFLSQDDCEPVVYGMEVTTQKVIVSHEELFSVKLEKVPAITASELCIAETNEHRKITNVMNFLQHGKID